MRIKSNGWHRQCRPNLRPRTGVNWISLPLCSAIAGGPKSVKTAGTSSRPAPKPNIIFMNVRKITDVAMVIGRTPRNVEKPPTTTAGPIPVRVICTRSTLVWPGIFWKR